MKITNSHSLVQNGLVRKTPKCKGFALAKSRLQINESSLNKKHQPCISARQINEVNMHILKFVFYTGCTGNWDRSILFWQSLFRRSFSTSLMNKYTSEVFTLGLGHLCLCNTTCATLSRERKKIIVSLTAFRVEPNLDHQFPDFLKIFQ